MKQMKPGKGKVSFPPDRNETTFGDRISEAAKLIGTRKSAADVMQCSTDSLARYIREEVEPPFSSVYRLTAASGKSLDWIATGIDEQEASRLDEFEAYLDEVGVPETAEEIDASPELQRIQRELKGFTSSRANLMNSLVFNNPEANRRRQAQLENAGEKLRKMNAVWTEAVDAVGHEPSVAVSEHLKTLIFKHQVTVEEILPLLVALNRRQKEE